MFDNKYTKEEIIGTVISYRKTAVDTYLVIDTGSDNFIQSTVTRPRFDTLSIYNNSKILVSVRDPSSTLLPESSSDTSEHRYRPVVHSVLPEFRSESPSFFPVAEGGSTSHVTCESTMQRRNLITFQQSQRINRVRGDPVEGNWLRNL